MESKSDSHEIIKGNFVVKCGLGLLFDDEWLGVYGVLCRSKILYFYASREDYETNPGNPSAELLLNSTHAVTDIKRKNYSVNEERVGMRYFSIYQHQLFGVNWSLYKVGLVSSQPDLPLIQLREAIEGLIHGKA